MRRMIVCIAVLTACSAVLAQTPAYDPGSDEYRLPITVPVGAAQIMIAAQAADVSGNLSDPVTHALEIVDDQAPAGTLTLTPATDILPNHELTVTEVSAELWRFLNHFGPYGQGNPKPIFLARGVALRGAPEVVGEEHLRLRIDVGDGATPEAIAFGQAAEIEWLNESSRVDLAFQVGVREWQGIEYVQAQVLDVRPSEAVWASSES